MTYVPFNRVIIPFQGRGLVHHANKLVGVTCSSAAVGCKSNGHSCCEFSKHEATHRGLLWQKRPDCTLAKMEFIWMKDQAAHSFGACLWLVGGLTEMDQLPNLSWRHNSLAMTSIVCLVSLRTAHVMNCDTPAKPPNESLPDQRRLHIDVSQLMLHISHAASLGKQCFLLDGNKSASCKASTAFSITSVNPWRLSNTSLRQRT